LTVTEYCRAQDLSVASFYHWRSRLKEAKFAGRAAAAKEPAAFLPVRIAGLTTEIHLPGGARVSLPAGDMTALRVAIQSASQWSPVSDREAQS
jgi:hypothetical protein